VINEVLYKRMIYMCMFIGGLSCVTYRMAYCYVVRCNDCAI
jgi:hypothetical protein